MYIYIYIYTNGPVLYIESKLEVLNTWWVI